MKKYILLTMSVVALGFTSCTDDEMDKVNENYENPAASKVSAHLQITDAEMSTAFATTSGDYAFYCSTFTEQEFGTGNNQLMKAELRNSGEVAAPSTFNNVWNSTYANLLNIKEMMDKINSGSASSGGMLDVLGAAQVLWVINFGILTEMHGDIPYSEALQGSANMTAAPDSQEKIYAALMDTLNVAIGNLVEAQEQGMGNMKSTDIIYAGSPAKWLAAAYAVKARYAIHQTCKGEQKYAQMAYDAAMKAKEYGFDGMLVSEFNGVTCDNPWSAFVWSRGYIAQSKTVTDLMGAGDPRLALYCDGYTPEEVAAQPGDEDAAKESWAWSYPGVYELGSQPVHIMSNHELYFILAEAAMRLNKIDEATSAFKTAVAQSIKEQSEWNDARELNPMTIDGETYAKSLGDATLEKIFQQKYLAGAIDEQVETYNDIRRCMGMGEGNYTYNFGKGYINLTNAKNTQGGMNRWPYSLPYGQSTLTNNPKMAELAGDGTYLYSDKLWIFTK